MNQLIISNNLSDVQWKVMDILMIPKVLGCHMDNFLNRIFLWMETELRISSP